MHTINSVKQLMTKVIILPAVLCLIFTGLCLTIERHYEMIERIHHSQYIHDQLLNEYQRRQINLSTKLDASLALLSEPDYLKSPKEYDTLLQHCCDHSNLLAHNVLAQESSESCSINDLLKTTEMIFAETMKKNGVSLHYSQKDNLHLEGDRLHLEMIFLNIIGRSIYATVNKTIHIHLTQEQKGLLITIPDQSYELTNHVKEKIISKSPLFLNDKSLQMFCEMNNVVFNKILIDKIPEIRILFRKDQIIPEGENIVRLHG